MIPDEWLHVIETPGMMPAEHLRWLINRASKVTSWTELGTYCGRSALAVGLSLPPGGLLQLVDIGFDPRFYTNLAWLMNARPSLRITLQQTTSVEAAKSLRATDVVFVDDDHSYEGVAASVDAWKGKYGTLCGHDYDNYRQYRHHRVYAIWCS